MLLTLRSSWGKRTFWKEANLRAPQRRRAAARSQDGPAGVPRVLRPLRRLGAVVVHAPDRIRDGGAGPDGGDLRPGLAVREALPGRGGRLGRALAVRHRAQPAAP